MVGSSRRLTVLAALLAVACCGPALAAEQVLEGASRIRMVGPNDVQASVLDGALRRTVTISGTTTRVVVDVPEGMPQRIEVRDVTEFMLPYVRGGDVVLHVRRAQDVAQADSNARSSTVMRARKGVVARTP